MKKSPVGRKINFFKISYLMSNLLQINMNFYEFHRMYLVFNSKNLSQEPRNIFNIKKKQ